VSSLELSPSDVVASDPSRLFEVVKVESPSLGWHDPCGDITVQRIDHNLIAMRGGGGGWGGRVVFCKKKKRGL
jgi:hypothetical protein